MENYMSYSTLFQVQIIALFIVFVFFFKLWRTDTYDNFIFSGGYFINLLSNYGKISLGTYL